MVPPSKVTWLDVTLPKGMSPSVKSAISASASRCGELKKPVTCTLACAWPASGDVAERREVGEVDRRLGRIDVEVVVEADDAQPVLDETLAHLRAHGLELERARANGDVRVQGGVAEAEDAPVRGVVDRAVGDDEVRGAAGHVAVEVQGDDRPLEGRDVQLLHVPCDVRMLRDAEVRA